MARIFYCFTLLYVAFAVLSCSGKIIVPAPPPAPVGPVPAEIEAESPNVVIVDGLHAEEGDDTLSVWVGAGWPTGRATVRTRDVDFARAFEEDPAPRDTAERVALPPGVHSLRYPSFIVRKRPARVMLRRDIKEAAINTTATAQVNAPGERMTFRGRMNIEADVGGSGMIIATVNRARRELRLPCTLFVSTDAHPLKIGENAYRGALIIVPEGRNSFTIINLINVEDYLRGVVPLEIGNLRESEIEAVKAQAVAARTYTYKKMAANESRVFDLVSTVADQVYGGANAETATSDMAILMTRNLILAYEGEIVHAYYHSTCGGKTANIQDVWGGQSVPYLRSIDDIDRRGRVYCSGASSFTWTETWPENQLAGIIRRHSSDGNLTPPFRGGLRNIEVRERHNCGRVKTLVVTSNSGGSEHTAGGDKIRWLLRRNTPARPILRSSNIRNIAMSGGQVTITGGGHGHGIGMCQVGAIGRARDGQNFEQILRAYYSGAFIRTVVDSR
ncbi:MAG: SpoIID/LytB domain-containing protein [Chitinispirillales bacterium]|jgi:stage II sporulation protein D|nr:SpoIID/LytB domain-containing protein [Chitinispirillales bacterium]